MSFFAKLFGLPVDCPGCGTPNAKVSFFATRCTNTGCRFYDPTLVREREASTPMVQPVERVHAGDFVGSFDIQYTNFQGQHKTFSVAPESLLVRHAHISAQVAPTGRRIALKRERIGNLQMVEQRIAAIPTPQEARIMRYHAEKGTTSPLNDSLRQKYPDA